MYRGQSGMWLWVLHRLTGVGVLAFLFLHIADTYLVGFGANYYNDLLFLYRNAPFRILEWFLVGAVLYHGLNGLRIILLDFWAGGIKRHQQLFVITVIAFFVLWLPAGYFMLKPVFFK
ncbi:MAG TPA: succinate dehydrogenase, cytochrome b556 subunit [Chloroflexia bacterium]|nr:succinate dehydrogenase, cytochrome b556 subunit [Chloroflexia bacterium]